LKKNQLSKKLSNPLYLIKSGVCILNSFSPLRCVGFVLLTSNHCYIPWVVLAPYWSPKNMAIKTPNLLMEEKFILMFQVEGILNLHHTYK
jgi:hypothetical protein